MTNTNTTTTYYIPFCCHMSRPWSFSFLSLSFFHFLWKCPWDHFSSLSLFFFTSFGNSSKSFALLRQHIITSATIRHGIAFCVPIDWSWKWHFNVSAFSTFFFVDWRLRGLLESRSIVSCQIKRFGAGQQRRRGVLWFLLHRAPLVHVPTGRHRPHSQSLWSLCRRAFPIKAVVIVVALNRDTFLYQVAPHFAELPSNDVHDLFWRNFSKSLRVVQVNLLERRLTSACEQFVVQTFRGNLSPQRRIDCCRVQFKSALYRYRHFDPVTNFTRFRTCRRPVWHISTLQNGAYLVRRGRFLGSIVIVADLPTTKVNRRYHWSQIRLLHNTTFDKFRKLCYTIHHHILCFITCRRRNRAIGTSVEHLKRL